MSTIEAREIADLRLHPDAEKVPLPCRADRLSLRDSLAEYWQQDPIDATPEGLILDGRTRWELLRDLGATTIQVRVVDLPTNCQTGYIVERALTRRHLTPDQKRALNDLLRVQVVEERPTKRGNVMRIGHSQTERAEKLGIDRDTVARWDAQPLVAADTATRELPTHAVDKRGRPQPLHKAPRDPESTPKSTAPKALQSPERPKPLRQARAIPGWSRQFSIWCRAARPEDREFLRRLDREIHAALDRNSIACEGRVAS
jgi:ParB-like chromosome segregation protein Spo0J